MTTATTTEKQLWASRFRKETDPVGKRYSESLTVDRPMIADDIWGNLAHVLMLGKTGIVAEHHAAKILGSLLKLNELWIRGEWELSLTDEDVQMNVERFVIHDIGMASGGRMHTTRSRNDQVPLDTKMYSRRRILDVEDRLVELVDGLLKMAPPHLETYMPGYTHTQHAQPITFAYWLTHYAAVFLRDLSRLKNAYDEVNTNPLGAGAISGTSFPIDRALTTRLLAFDGIQEHALDVVGARDWNLTTLSALANLMTTTSRVAEEIIYWITHEFRMLALDDSFGMGSSMMPQKKNPGVLELMRARAGTMNGILVAMLTCLKGTHSGYNRDLHEDKVTLVTGLTLAHDTVEVLGRVMGTLIVNKERMAELCDANFAAATELTNYLVRDHDVPFRECHKIVGFVVAELVREGKSFRELARTAELLSEKGIRVGAAELKPVLATPDVVQRQTSLGACAPREVARMIDSMSIDLARKKAALSERRERLTRACAATFQTAKDVAAGKTSISAGLARWGDS